MGNGMTVPFCTLDICGNACLSYSRRIEFPVVLFFFRIEGAIRSNVEESLNQIGDLYNIML